MSQQKLKSSWRFLLPGCLLLLIVLLAGCGGAASGSANYASVNAPNVNGGGGAVQAPAAANNNGSNSGSNNQSGSAVPVAQYLIKTLKVTMAVKDTRKVADDLQTWITNTDPRAVSAGIDYEQAGNNLYNITFSYEVEATDYPQVEHYLADYAGQHGGQLVSLNESVQDVTNDYIDTQSRLTNLKTEQARLLTLLSQAQALGDVITLQDKLTDVEGQIETMEAHLKELSGQVAYYTVSIDLQPIEIAPPPPTPAGWSVGQVIHDAFAASLSFAQGLLSLLIWLFAFAIYIVPVVLIAWGVMRWRGAHARRVPPPAMPMMPPPAEVQ
jgi:hypothetical protein